MIICWIKTKSDNYVGLFNSEISMDNEYNELISEIGKDNIISFEQKDISHIRQKILLNNENVYIDILTDSFCVKCDKNIDLCHDIILIWCTNNITNLIPEGAGKTVTFANEIKYTTIINDTFNIVTNIKEISKEFINEYYPGVFLNENVDILFNIIILEDYSSAGIIKDHSIDDVIDNKMVDTKLKKWCKKNNRKMDTIPLIISYKLNDKIINDKYVAIKDGSVYKIKR